jgi:NAD+ diphosphatase
MPRKLNEQKFCGWCGAQVAYKSEWMSECPNCGYKNYFNPKPCTNLIIRLDDKVLLSERALDPGKGKLDLPGGFMDMTDRDIETTVYREVQEELGLARSDISKLKYIGSLVQKYHWQNSEVYCACFFFVCDLLKSAKDIVVDQTENTRVRWIGTDDLQHVDFAFEVDKEMLTKYFEEMHE